MKVLKLSDKVYAQSLSRWHGSYEEGFPQREQYLFEQMKSCCDFQFFRHGVLDTLERVREAQDDLLHTFVFGDEEYDVVIFDNPLSALILPDRKKIKGHPKIVWDVCDWYERMFKCEFGNEALRTEKYYLLKMGMEKASRIATKIVAQGPEILSWVQKSWKVTKDVLVLPNGYDETYCYPKQLPIGGHCSIPLVPKADEKLVCFAGKLGLWYKGILRVAKAVEKMVGYSLLVVGEGPLRKSLEGRKKIICIGRVPKEVVADCVNYADVCVMPVDDDSPIATTEYMACGKPVVHLGKKISWLVQDGINGCLIDDVDNLKEWTSSISFVYQRKEIIGESNLKRVKHMNLSWQELSQKFVDFLSKESASNLVGL